MTHASDGCIAPPGAPSECCTFSVPKAQRVKSLAKNYCTVYVLLWNTRCVQWQAVARERHFAHASRCYNLSYLQVTGY